MLPLSGIIFPIISDTPLQSAPFAKNSSLICLRRLSLRILSHSSPIICSADLDFIMDYNFWPSFVCCASEFACTEIKRYKSHDQNTNVAGQCGKHRNFTRFIFRLKLMLSCCNFITLCNVYYIKLYGFFSKMILLHANVKTMRSLMA